MREYNKNATVDTAALCKTFSGNGEESWCEATRPTTGCLYIYPEESAIELRLFSGCDPHVDDIIVIRMSKRCWRGTIRKAAKTGTPCAGAAGCQAVKMSTLIL